MSEQNKSGSAPVSRKPAGTAGTRRTSAGVQSAVGTRGTAASGNRAVSGAARTSSGAARTAAEAKAAPARPRTAAAQHGRISSAKRRRKMSPLERILANPLYRWGAIVAGLLIVLIIVIVCCIPHGEDTAAKEPAVPAITEAPIEETVDEETAAEDGELAEAVEEPDAEQPEAAVNIEQTALVWPNGQERTSLKLGESALQQRVDSSRASRAANRPGANDGWLPVFREGSKTQENMIAITVDDCFQASNLRKIIDCALENGGKLTIFPIGQNLMKESVAQHIKYAWENGMEIENHTYSHNGLYRSSNEELAFEIFGQNALLCNTLGVNYQAHFLRPKGGDARADQRIHTYIDQMGYYGVAHWSFSGSGSTNGQLKNSLKPGQIYLFHTTDKDLEKLLNFIPYAVSQGYKLVTLNEMFGYPENETSEFISLTTENIVPLREYEVVPVTCKKGTYSYLAKRIQDRLFELGYLKEAGDGVYGDGTVKAVKNFQSKAGLKADGNAGADTQSVLFSENAPRAK